MIQRSLCLPLHLTQVERLRSEASFFWMVLLGSVPLSSPWLIQFWIFMAKSNLKKKHTVQCGTIWNVSNLKLLMTRTIFIYVEITERSFLAFFETNKKKQDDYDPCEGYCLVLRFLFTAGFEGFKSFLQDKWLIDSFIQKRPRWLCMTHHVRMWGLLSCASFWVTNKSFLEHYIPTWTDWSLICPVNPTCSEWSKFSENGSTLNL